MKEALVGGGPEIDGSLRPSSSRVLLVADSLDVGGAERHVLGLATGLMARGHEVAIACSVGGGLACLAEQCGVRVWPLMDGLVKRRVSLAFARKLRQLAHEQRVDVVHAHMYASAAAAAVALLGTDVPLVISEHSAANWRSRPTRWVSRLMYQRAARIIAVSDEIRARLIEHEGAPAGRVVLIRNALPPLPSAADERSIPRQEHEVLIGVVARLQPEKGVLHFVEAAARVARLAPQARFVIVGDGPLRAELAARAEQLGLAPRLELLGFTMSAPSLIRQLDLLVVPSLSEGTPLVVLEAMQAGVPLVASAVGGIPEQVRHAHEALLVPPGDEQALASAILVLVQDPHRGQELGQAARRRAVQEFDHAAMLTRTTSVYEHVLAVGPRYAFR